LAPKEYKNGESIPFKGEQKKIQIEIFSGKKIQVKFEQQVFYIYLPEDVAEESRDSLIREALIEWMKQQAATEVKNSVEIYAEKYNLYPRFIRIKTQKSRWGSCGARNDINLNWLLILTPPKVLEYVVIHELCHIQERNHSADFWQLVEQNCPDYKQHRLWLKQNGQSIMQGL
jgi:predicted metal-dependent hydrolase